MQLEKRIYETLSPVVGGNSVMPVIARAGIQPPFIIYHRIAEDIVTTFEGQTVRNVWFSLNLQAETYGELLTLETSVISALRRAKLLVTLGAVVDDYNADLNLHQRIRTVIVK